MVCALSKALIKNSFEETEPDKISAPREMSCWHAALEELRLIPLTLQVGSWRKVLATDPPYGWYQLLLLVELV